MMQTFYIDKNDVNDNRLTVKGDVCHHISRVLRMRAGDSLRFSDNENHYYEGVIAEITKEIPDLVANTKGTRLFGWLHAATGPFMLFGS